MTLIFHDWFATSGAVAAQHLMIDQNETLRRNALGSFPDGHDVTVDPAMILWLNQQREHAATAPTRTTRGS